MFGCLPANLLHGQKRVKYFHVRHHLREREQSIAMRIELAWRMLALSFEHNLSWNVKDQYQVGRGARMPEEPVDQTSS